MSITNIHPDDVRVIPEMELCDRLRRSLRLIGLSNGEVADLMGVRPNAVSAWLNGHNRPNKAVLRIWSDMTGCDLHWLEKGQAPSGDPTGPAVYAIRDSNPEPADSEFQASGVKRGLTLILPIRAA